MVGSEYEKREAKWREVEARYETRASTATGAVVVRLDGRAFHTLTKGMDKPFDLRMVAAMESAALSAADAVNGCLLAYWQSDEISLVFPSRPSETGGAAEGVLPFGGRAQKLSSVLASAAAVGFVRAMPEAPGTPCFDGRVLVADTPGEVSDYLAWRIADSRKNAISSAAHALFGHSRLVGVGTAERRHMLEGTEWETVPEDFYHGKVAAKEPYETHVTWVDREGTRHEADATRHRWEIRAATDDVVSEMEGRIASVVAGGGRR